MWPWEHVAVGYVLISTYHHARFRAPPGDAVAIVAVLGAALPDLVDKPLSWSLGLFPSGYSIAHSAFVASLLILLVAGLGYRYGRPEVATAFALGYGSHLVGDVLFPALQGGRLAFERVLWPVVTLPPYDRQLDLVSRTLLYLHRHVARTLSGGIGPGLVLEVSLVLFVLLLWFYDGFPGTGRGQSGEGGRRWP